MASLDMYSNNKSNSMIHRLNSQPIFGIIAVDWRMKMDIKKIGFFISQLRKQKGYTQKDLAEKLMVTDKAISRWETGKGLPETSILKHLSEILGVSVGELLSGERIDDERMKEKNDEVILDSLKYSRRMLKNLINIVLIIIGCGFILFPLYRGTGYGYYVLGGFFIFLAILRMFFNRREINIKNSYRAMYSFILLSQVMALVFEMFPDALMLPFASGPNHWVTKTFSYFSLTPFGYAEFFPVLTGVLTIIIIALSAINLIQARKAALKLQNADFICAIIAFVFSILHLLKYGAAYMSFPSYAISALILISTALQAVANRRIENK